ncbi:hypothetical protein ACWFMI_23260 [Nocardiopsis terrae]|uniref:hypothetical protein n=1 Tax=Streptomyces sp. NPDC057554 TaxID=3350538 RepID=UPI00367F3120
MHHDPDHAQAQHPHLPPLPRRRWAFNTLTLGRVYDHLVINRALTGLWGADAYLVHQLYEGNIGARHLELGTLASAFLAHALDAHREVVQQVHLLDHDLLPVRSCARRVRARGYTPDQHVLDPRTRWPLPVGGLDSVASVMWTHTLPSPNRDLLFYQVARALAPGGRFFGAAVVGPLDPGAEPLTARAQRRRALYNRLGLFCNLNDTRRTYHHLLTRAFGPRTEVHTRLVGAVVLWEVTLR